MLLCCEQPKPNADEADILLILLFRIPCLLIVFIFLQPSLYVDIHLSHVSSPTNLKWLELKNPEEYITSWTYFSNFLHPQANFFLRFFFVCNNQIRKAGQQLKYVGKESTHTPGTLRAIPSGVLNRLAKLASRKTSLHSEGVEKVYPDHANALRKAGLATPDFPIMGD